MSPAAYIRKLTNYNDPSSLGSRMRARRVTHLLKLVEAAHSRHGFVRILDVGGRRSYWNILPLELFTQYSIHITLLNLPNESSNEDDAHFFSAVGDACRMPQFADDSFHIVHSNSVIEHVGGWTNAAAFAAEVRRVARGLFIQTPNYWFPVEPHYVFPFFQYLPRPLQEQLVLTLPLGHSGRRAPCIEAAIRRIDASPRLLDARAFRLLFPDCTIVRERILFLTKSLIAIRPL